MIGKSAGNEIPRQKLERLERQVEILEAMIEDRSREAFVVNERLSRASDFLKRIYKAMPGALFVFDRKGRIEAVNDAAVALLGTTEPELVGKYFTEILEASGTSDLIDPDILILEGTYVVLRGEGICTAKSGERIPVLYSVTPLDGSDVADSIEYRSGGVCVALDVREQKKLEVELRQAQKLESVGRLAAGVAHEINTPVQFVSDSLHFARDAFDDILRLIDKYNALHSAVVDGASTTTLTAEIAAVKDDSDLMYLLENVPKAIARSLDGLERIATIVRSMKEFSHPDQAEMAPVNLNDAIQSTLTIARHEYKYVADIETDFGELPPVRCFVGDINQVILNLVVNAAHAIGDVVGDSGDKGRITIRTRKESESAQISISDTGTGIPAVIRDQIFDPFFTTKGVGKGTGQGLSIARSVVEEKHGGKLTFETSEGRGTTFFIRLPIAGTTHHRSRARA